jgi:hypothetical protein
MPNIRGNTFSIPAAACVLGVAVCAGMTLGARPAHAELVAKQINVGTYQSSTAGSLAAGGHLDENGRYVAGFKFNGSAGQKVRFYLNSADFDAYLLLGTEEGTMLADNDNMNTASTNSEIIIQLPASGVYLVFVTSKSEGKTGSFKLYFENVTP